jgi:hypothetical protein
VPSKCGCHTTSKPQIESYSGARSYWAAAALIASAHIDEWHRSEVRALDGARAHQTTNLSAVVGADDLEVNHRAKERKTMSDMSQYAGSQYWKIIDVRDGPVKMKIEAVSISKFNKPDLVFSDGSKFSVNATNAKTLCRSYGKNDSDWIGKEIQLEIGEVEFEGEKISTVIIRPISPATVKSAAPAKAKTAAARPDYDDEIPF